jgi:hypothetical protein
MQHIAVVQKVLGCDISYEVRDGNVIGEAFCPYGQLTSKATRYVEDRVNRELYCDEWTRLREACVLTMDDVNRIRLEGLRIPVFAPQNYRYMILDHSDWRLDYFYEWQGAATTGSGADTWFKLCPELVEFCQDVDTKARTIQLAERWTLVRNMVHARGVCMFWLEQTQVHLCAPGGEGRKRDREAFERC